MRKHLPSALWLSGALGLIAFSIYLTGLSQDFGYDWAVYDMPVPRLAALVVGAGILYFIGFLAARYGNLAVPLGNVSLALTVMIAAGIAARLILFASEPALEDDYQRYMWDGAVTAHGFNPYATAPARVIEDGADSPLAEIAEASSPVLERVNHHDLTTIYPPVAQGAFALAHIIEPFSLASWRSLLLAADLATLGLILLLLGTLSQSPLWAALYWWNPVVLKEFFNSSHMDALLLPLLLAALNLALKQRAVAATVALAGAVATKVWPLLLVPLLWRHTIANRSQALMCAAVFGVLMALAALPYAAAGLSDDNGTLAYAQTWTINSPIFATLRDGLSALLVWFVDSDTAASVAALAGRAILAACVAGVAIAMAYQPTRDRRDFLTRALVIIAALVLLSPAIYPWYTLWMLPLLALLPHAGLLLVSATIPLYYLLFYFAAREASHVYESIVVWIIWIPVWSLCLFLWWQGQRQPDSGATAKFDQGASGRAA